MSACLLCTGLSQASADATEPGLLVAGDNPVSTDAVGTALMGYDPMADRGTPLSRRTGPLEEPNLSSTKRFESCAVA